MKENSTTCIFFTNKIIHLCTDSPRLLRPAPDPRRYNFSWNERKIVNNDLRYLEDLDIYVATVTILFFSKFLYSFVLFWGGEIYIYVFGCVFGHQHSRSARHVLRKTMVHAAGVLSLPFFALPAPPFLSPVASLAFASFFVLAATTSHSRACFPPTPPPSAPPPSPPAGRGGPRGEGAAILSSC